MSAMATAHTRVLASRLLSPAVILLFIWMIIPLVMTLYFSFQNYNLLIPGDHPWIGFSELHPALP